ncbi:MAG: nucleotidyltransferase family protein [Candidatus Woesearchaeota archaeon]
MDSIILAAGYGTRLYPLTQKTPKPLLEVGEKPILEHIVEKILSIKDFDKIFIVTNLRFKDDFTKWLDCYASKSMIACKSKDKIEIVDDGATSHYDRLGAIGDITFAVKKKALLNKDLLIIGGDNLFDFSLEDFISFYYSKSGASVAIYDIKDCAKAAGKYGVVELDSDKRIISFEEKPKVPKTSLVSTACYIFPKYAVDWLIIYHSYGHKSDNTGDFLSWLCERQPVYGYVFEGMWFDIGTLEQLEEARKAFSI